MKSANVGAKTSLAEQKFPKQTEAVLLDKNFSNLRLDMKSVIQTHHNDFLLCLTAIGPNLVATGSRDSTIEIWDTDQGVLVSKL
jgi:WD40 repeat protein